MLKLKNICIFFTFLAFFIVKSINASEVYTFSGPDIKRSEHEPLLLKVPDYLAEKLGTKYIGGIDDDKGKRYLNLEPLGPNRIYLQNANYRHCFQEEPEPPYDWASTKPRAWYGLCIENTRGVYGPPNIIKNFEDMVMIWEKGKELNNLGADFLLILIDILKRESFEDFKKAHIFGWGGKDFDQLIKDLDRNIKYTVIANKLRGIVQLEKIRTSHDSLQIGFGGENNLILANWNSPEKLYDVLVIELSNDAINEIATKARIPGKAVVRWK